MFLYKQLIVNNIDVEDFPYKKEISMEALIIENANILSLGEDFGDVSIIDHQVPLSSNNRIDILATYGSEYLAMIELKLDEINEKTIEQLGSYLQERDHILKKYKDKYDNDPKWIGIIVGKTISPNIALEIRKGRYFQESIPIAAITMNRFKSNDGQIYVITDTYFPEKVNGKDYTRYSFNGNKFSKGRLVHDVIRKYLDDNPDTTFAKLRIIFPDNLQGSWGVIQEKKEAEKRQGDYKRYFTNPEDLLMTADKVELAVCNQWGVKNIDGFIDTTKKLKYKITQE